MIWLSVQPWKKGDTDPNVSDVLAGEARALWSTLQRGSVQAWGERRSWGKEMEGETEEEQQREMD